MKNQKEEKIDNNDLRIYINSKGLGRAIQYTINYKKIEDKEIAKYWRYAKKYIDLVKNTLNEKLIQGE